MKKLVILFIVIILLISAFIFFNKPKTQRFTIQTPTPFPTTQNQTANIKASFTIITGNIARSFKAEKYHNQSPNVYITADDSSIIHVKAKGITYDDFFKTLPMKLTKVCLTTGDGETFCSGSGRTLKFYLNDIETPDLLNREIKDEDKALIKFI